MGTLKAGEMQFYKRRAGGYVAGGGRGRTQEKRSADG